MFGRILGILAFRRSTYLEVAKDPAATGQAVILVVIASILYSLIDAFIFAGGREGTGGAHFAAVIGRAAASFVSYFAAWFLTVVLLVLIASLFKGKTTFGEMLRVTGFVEIFTIIACLCGTALAISGPVSAVEIVVFVISVLALGGYVIGVSETAGITMGKALATSFVAGIAGFFVEIFLAGLILSALRIPPA
jgi:hypothetical protein